MCWLVKFGLVLLYFGLTATHDAGEICNGHHQLLDSDTDGGKVQRDLHLYDDELYSHRRSKRKTSFLVSKMPSGAEVTLVGHSSHNSRCYKSKLITLHPNRYKSRKEFKIIRDEMMKTWKAIQDCENRAGCFKGYAIQKIHKVENGCLWQRYKDRAYDVKRENGNEKNERLLFYGTPFAWHITHHGFDERLGKAGEYGAGIYFTDSSAEANEHVFGPVGTGCKKHSKKDCTECIRTMLVARVELGKESKEGTPSVHAHAPIGHHSVIGKQSTNPYTEYIVYRGEQAYVEFVISYKIII